LSKKNTHEPSAMLARVKYDGFSVMKTPHTVTNRVDS
jgi:hypothetical protein